MKIKSFFSKSIFFLILLALNFSFASVGFSACPDSLSNYWTFDSDTDGATMDEAGTCHGTDGVLSSGAPSGRVGVSRYFDGSTSYSFPGYSDYSWHRDVSVNVWCKFTSSSADSMVMLGSHTDSKTQWWIGIEGGTGYPMFSLYDSLGVGSDVKGSQTINNDEWHLLTGTYEDVSNSLRLYLDGVLLQDISISYTGSFKTEEIMTMGALDTLGTLDFFYSGYLDEVGLFRKALTITEINFLYQKGLNGINYCDDFTAPTITSTPLETILQLEDYSYTVEATGIPAPEFALITSPAGMTIDAVSGEISWTPSIAGTFDVNVEASNLAGSDTQEFTIVVDELIGPAITSTPEDSALQFEIYSYIVTATGYPAPGFALLESPAGMTIDAVSGEISWTPSVHGSFNVSIEARNDAGTDIQDYTLVVHELILPEITSIPELRTMVDELYTYDVVADGNPLPVLSLETSPSGMSLNASNGELTWTPHTPGTYDVSISATNIGGSDEQDFTLEVISPCMSQLISYFDFSEGNGYETDDNAHPRTLDLTGNAYWVPGVAGDALAFDGNAQYLSFPDDSDFDWSNSQNFSIELWCRVDADKSGLQVFYGRETPGATHWWIGLGTNKKVSFFLYDETRAGGGMQSLNTINDGSWHHVAAVHIASENRNLLYVDGLINADTTFAYSAGFSSSADVQIANFYAGGQHDYLFRGSLDEIAVSNRAIDAGEILEHYLKGVNSQGYCNSFSLAPTITSIPVTSIMVNDSYTYSVIAEGIPAPTFSLQTSPAGMSINSTTGEITWTPTIAGDFNVVVEASNSAGSTTQNYSIRVFEACMADLISYLRFSEGSGLFTYDDADTRVLEANGSINWTSGVAGSALSFDGSSGYLSFPDKDDFDWSSSQDFSIELWCKVSGNNNELQVMIGRETPGSSTHWWVGTNQSKQIAFYLFDENNIGGGLIGQQSINDGQWHHVAAVHQGGSKQNRLYIDGELEADTSFAYTAGFSSAADIQIANFFTGYQHKHFFEGSLDEIAVLNRELPEDEIYEHFIKGSNGVDYCADFTLSPTIISTPDTLAVINKQYSCTILAEGLPIPVYTLDQSPSGMTIDPFSGEINWVPGSGGYYSVTARATNSAGTTTQEFNILVLETCMENLISYLRFSEGSGSLTYDDASPRILDMDGNASWTTGKVGSGAAFDGVSQRLALEDDADFDWSAVQDFTVELWCRTTGNKDELQVLIGRETVEGTHWWMGMNSEKKAAFYLFDETREGGGMLGKDSIDDGAWHHIAAVHIGSQNRNLLYVDGELNADTSFAYVAGFSSSADIQIANFYQGGQNSFFFQGELDEIAVSNRAIVETEIYAHYMKGMNLVDYCENLSIVPVILSEPDTLTMVQFDYSYKVIAEGLPKPVYSLLESPTGLTIDPSTGEINWTPDSSGIYTVIVRAENSAGNTFQNFSLEVLEPCMDELVTFLKFDEGTGAVSINYANLQEIQIEGNADWSEGRVGNGLSFDGATQALSLSPAPVFDWAKSQDFTLELWFNTATTKTGLQVLMGRDTPGSTHWWLGLNDAYQAAFYLNDELGNGGGVIGTDPLNDGNWHHLVAVHTGADGSISLYVDSKLNSEISYNYTAGFASTSEIQIANLFYSYAYNFFFEGKLDEIAVLNRALSGEEIVAHYLKGLNEAGYCDDLVLIPEITSEPNTEAYSNNLYTYDVQATGLPAPAFQLNNPPSGMIIDAESGIIEWTPGSDGNFDIEVAAVNSGGEDIQQFTIHVTGSCVEEGISYFNFEESSGSGAEDQLSDRVGQLLNNPVRQEAKIGKSIMFNGIDQSIIIPDHDDFDFPEGSSFSFELWCKPTGTNNSLQVFLGRNEQDGVQWWIGLQDNSKFPAVYVFDQNRLGDGVTGTIDIGDGKWHHLAAVYTQNDKQLSLYIDGTLNVQVEINFSGGFTSTSIIQVASLYMNGSYQFFYEGELDEIVMYDRAITKDEIELHHELGNLGLGYCFGDGLAIETPKDFKSLEYTIYPIPAQDKLFIDFASQESERVRIQLINSLGIIAQDEIRNKEEQIEIDVSGLVNGFYILRVANKENLLIQESIVIQ